eukprot:gene9935-12183_t
MLFLFDVKSMYHNHFYHNFVHAFDVTQTIFSYLTEMKLSQFFSSMDILVLLICAICHDLDHPGYNNHFMINSSSELAKLYNFQSVLENHHLSTMYKLLSKHKLLSSLSNQEIKQFKKLSSHAILATDMSFHNKICSKLEQKVKENLNNINESIKEIKSLKNFPDISQSKDRTFLIEVLLHAADISNITKPWNTSKEWTFRINQEQFQQYLMEKKNGITTSSLYNADSSIEKLSAQNSIKFIEFIGEPFFTLISSLFPETEICVDYLKENKVSWINLS